MNVFHRTALAVAATAPLLLVGLSARAADDILATADKAGSFKTLIAAVKAAGLAETLTGKGPLTVFAPTDDAFKKLPAATLEALLKPENKATLVSILKYHVLPGAYASERLMQARSRTYTVKTAEGTPVLFDKKDGLTIGGAKIAKTDIAASNGTIHGIDAVIMPAAIQKALALPAAMAPKAETPKAFAPGRGGQPIGTPAPAAKAETPKADAPKADAAKADAAKADAAKAGTPAAPLAPKK